jgi:hypothetical protein
MLECSQANACGHAFHIVISFTSGVLFEATTHTC